MSDLWARCCRTNCLWFSHHFTHSCAAYRLLPRMTLEDFCKFYSDLDICCLCPDFLDGSSSCHWKSSFHEGRWVAGITAGGCMNNPGTTSPTLQCSLRGRIANRLQRKLYASSVAVPHNPKFNWWSNLSSLNKSKKPNMNSDNFHLPIWNNIFIMLQTFGFNHADCKEFSTFPLRWKKCLWVSCDF